MEIENLDLPTDWQVSSLQDVCENMKQGKVLPQSKIVVNGPFPVYGANGRIGFSKEYFLEEERVLITCRGSTCGFINKAPKRSFVTNNAMILFQKEFVHTDFLKFVLQEYSTVSLKVGSGQPQLTKGILNSHKIPLPPIPEQRNIAAVLGLVQRAMEQQERLIALTTELKKALLHKLFTEGLHGEPQKQTAIGPVPESWEVEQLGTCCDVVSGSLSYTDFLQMASSDTSDAIACMGVKVSDMNLPGNERRFVTANLVKQLPPSIAYRKLVPPNTLVFPKRGAAIATNKKRLTTTWTVLAPNLIGLSAKNSLDEEFLFYWSQTFDLRKITDPGPTPQLNKKDLVPILIPLPKDIDDQREIAATLSCVDSKTSAHQRKHDSLCDLFRTLLHQLMTAQIRVYEIDVKLLTAGTDEPCQTTQTQSGI